MKFYKYTSMANAIKIIKSSSVILNNPKNFNDPFDTNFIIDEKDKKKALELMYNFYLFKCFKEISYRKDIKLSKSQKVIFDILRKECTSYEKFLLKRKEYIKIPLLNKLIKVFEKNIDKFKYSANEFEQKFNDMIKDNFSKIREKLLITCFSKRNDSILMWSHYGDSHKGVCFEFEDNRDIYKDVVYSNKRPQINIKKLIGKIFFNEHINNKNDDSYNEYIETIMNQFFVKLNDWNYEKEIRCLLSAEKNECVDFYCDQGRYFLNMKITRIYIGIRAINDEILNDLIYRTKNRNIPVIFMKEDPIYFKIVPDYNKKANFNYIEKQKKSDIELLSNEIEKCLNSDCYLAAFSLSLIIPSILGKNIYPELNEKDSYIKWYQDNIEKYEINGTKKSCFSGILIYELKESLLNNWNTLIKDNFENSELNNIKLVIQDKTFNDIYQTCINSSVFSYTMETKRELQINIRDFCNKMLSILKSEINANPKLLEISNISLRHFDKEIDNLNELNLCIEK